MYWFETIFHKQKYWYLYGPFPVTGLPHSKALKAYNTFSIFNTFLQKYWVPVLAPLPSQNLSG